MKKRVKTYLFMVFLLGLFILVGTYFSHPYSEQAVYKAPFLDTKTNTLIENAKDSYIVPYGLILYYEFMPSRDRTTLDEKSSMTPIRGIASYSKSLFLNRYRLTSSAVYDSQNLPMTFYLENALYETRASFIFIDGHLKGAGMEKEVSEAFKNLLFFCVVFTWFFSWL